MSKRVVIVGAGPGGLACALLLAKSGLDVTIVERQPFIGGRTSAIVRDGYRFDRGPTFFLYPRILEEIFQSIGRDLRTEVPMKRLDPQYHLVFGGGGELSATPDIPRLKEAVSQLSPRDSQHIEAFLSDNRAKLERFSPILEGAFPTWSGLLNPALASCLPLVRLHKSVDADLSSYFEDPRIRLAFSFQSKYLGMSPFQCPSLFTILSYLEYEHGVYHPYGGCARVSERMAEIAQEMGVAIHTSEEVEGLEFDGKRPVRVQCRTQSFACDSLVVNADFARAMIRLVPNWLRRTWSDQRIAKAKLSCSTFMLYLGLKGLDPIPHHTIYFSKNYQQNLADITANYRLSEDPSFYVQNACVTDPALAPEGCSTLYVLVPVPHQHASLDWKVLAPQMREVALDQLSKAGVTDVRNRIVVEEMVTPDDWDRFEIHRGATFSLAHTLDQMLFMRPQNRYNDLDGTYLVGGGTHPGSGLPVIYSSARITAGLLLEDLGMTAARRA